MSIYEDIIFKSRYARFLEKENRRETWEEAVDRYYTHVLLPSKLDTDTLLKVKESITNMEVMPSMRALMTAGPALDRDHVAGYNCSYIPIDNIRSFDELMYILLCGTGVGFSVERQEISKLPSIPEEYHETDTVIVVADSKIGWASSFRELIALLYAGKIPKWDLSKIRPAGSRLKVFGGRASGPAPLEDLFKFTVGHFKQAIGRKFTSLEVHDLVCKIADIVVVGGVRRSALISLSNLTDLRMQGAKAGQWWVENSQRALANNSVAYTELPDVGIFLKEWTSLYESKSGERGIFNRFAAKKQVESSGRRDPNFPFGSNPCGEIILRPYGFCNLTEVVARPEDTLDTLKNKVKLATLIGTVQSTFTNFRYLRSIWKKNAEEERLLGVSITGIMDCPLLYSGDNLDAILTTLKEVAIEENKKWSSILGIPQSAAITCVKPSGTVSQRVGCSSGIHPAYSEYYIRTIRADVYDPMTSFLKESGIPWEADITNPSNTVVFSFPQEAPKGAITRNKITAIQQLELYLKYKNYWCEHNPSITVYVKEEEWPRVGAFVFDNFKDIIGVTFLPYSDHIYKQAPYQEISKEEFLELKKKIPNTLDWEKLVEDSDNTTGSQELACVSGVCSV